MIGAGLYIWMDGAHEINKFYSYQLRMCFAIEDSANDSLQYIQDPAQRERRATENKAQEKKCAADAAELFHKEFDEQYRALPVLLGVDVFSVAVGWLLIWFVVGVVKWVRRGFVSAEAN
jgi:hypothetical protein